MFIECLNDEGITRRSINKIFTGGRNSHILFSSKAIDGKLKKAHMQHMYQE